jgi:PKHD-type hydroxylase
MYLTLANVLSLDTLASVLAATGTLTWQPGELTAGGRARAVKHNLQADLRSGAGEALHAALLDDISVHAVLRAAARPRRFSRLLLSRTEDGGHYGRHVDNALMPVPAGRLRTDLSFTLFLSDPAAYDGGELVIDTPAGDYTAKPDAGDLVLYPSGAIHEVRPVTRGTRLACVGWIESSIRDAAARDILFDLENLKISLVARLPSDAPELLALDKSIGALLRRWADA